MNSNKSPRLDCAHPKTPEELKLTALCDLWLRAAQSTWEAGGDKFDAQLQEVSRVVWVILGL